MINSSYFFNNSSRADWEQASSLTVLLNWFMANSYFYQLVPSQLVLFSLSSLLILSSESDF